MASPRRQRTQSYCGRAETATEKLIEVGKLVSDQGHDDNYYALMGCLTVYDKQAMVRIFKYTPHLIKDIILREYLFQHQLDIINELLNHVDELPCRFVSTLAICPEGGNRIGATITPLTKGYKLCVRLGKRFDKMKILELVVLERNYKLYSRLCKKFDIDRTDIITLIRADHLPTVKEIESSPEVVMAVIESGNFEAAVTHLTRYHLDNPDIRAISMALCYNSTDNGKKIFDHVYTTYVAVRTKYTLEYQKHLMYASAKYRRLDILKLILDTTKNKHLDVRCLNHHESLSEELISHYKLMTTTPRTVDAKINATLDVVTLLEHHKIVLIKPIKLC